MSVTILMGTLNGGAHLEEQLASIEGQTAGEIGLVVSDDGSSDNTLAILAAAAANWQRGRFEISSGPAKGFAANFRSLLATTQTSHDYVALSDQDDVWDADKLEVAVRWLKAQGDTPALYCSRTRYVDAGNSFLRLSPLFAKPPSFANALVQSIAGANTMVMNRRAFDLVAEASRRSAFVSHDWWCYMIVSGAGGSVGYDPEPHIAYRQHAENVMGANDTFSARMMRIRGLFAGRFSAWMDENLTALATCGDLLSPESRERISSFRTARAGNGVAGLRAFLHSGVHRQTVFCQAALWLAFIARKL